MQYFIRKMDERLVWKLMQLNEMIEFIHADSKGLILYRKYNMI